MLHRRKQNKVVPLAQTVGARAVALQLDVADAASSDGFVDQVREALAALGAERFDHLVNNAGTSSNKTLENDHRGRDVRAVRRPPQPAYG